MNNVQYLVSGRYSGKTWKYAILCFCPLGKMWRDRNTGLFCSGSKLNISRQVSVPSWLLHICTGQQGQESSFRCPHWASVYSFLFAGINVLSDFRVQNVSWYDRWKTKCKQIRCRFRFMIGIIWIRSSHVIHIVLSYWLPRRFPFFCPAFISLVASLFT